MPTPSPGPSETPIADPPSELEAPPLGLPLQPFPDMVSFSGLAADLKFNENLTIVSVEVDSDIPTRKHT